MCQEEDSGRKMRSCLPAFARILLFLPGLSLGVPFLVSIVTENSLSAIISLAGTAFLIEYGAVVFGIARGIGFLPTIVVTSSVALAVILTSFELFDLLTGRFGRVEQFLERVKRGRVTGFISHYGMWGLLPGIFVGGFYICPAVSWIFSWKRSFSVTLMMAGYVVSAVAVYIVTTGILTVVF